MALSPQSIIDARKVYETFWESYLAGDVNTFASTLDDNFEMIGTSESERCHNKEEGIEFFKSQAEELVGKAEMRNRQVEAIPVEAMVLINELCHIYVLAENDWNFYSIIRISTFLRETSDGWKVVQQHGSLPDNRVQDGETLAIDKINRENIELRDAVKRRTAELEYKNRELAIETALERTRTQSMLMQHSDEIKSISNVFHEQLLLLDIPSEFSYVWLPDESTNSHQFWASWSESKKGKTTLQSKQVTYPLDKSEPYTAACFAAWANPEMILEEFIPPSDISGFFDVWQELLDGAQKLKAEFFPQGIYYSEAYMRYGCFGINIRRTLSHEEKNILKRFSIEFERAYTRFLDLQKAEAQAREAKIETALEKVRSRSLAMHKSDELNEVVSVLFEKLKDLQIPFTAVGIATRIEGSKDLNAFVCGQNDAGLVITNYRLPYFDNPIPKDLYNALENQLDPFVAKYTKEEKDAFYEYVLAHTVEFRHLPEDIKHMIFESPTYTITHVAVKNAVFNVNDFEGKVLDEHEVDIIKRFARVFDQAYTRFLDLQKAEAQAREAQIEAALEKVRSRTMAMQKGEELQEVAVLLYKELIALGVTNFVTCGYVEIDENINRQSTWVTAPGGDTLGLFYLPLTGDATFDERYAAWKRQQVIFHQTVAGEVRSNHLEYAITTFNSKEAEEMVRSQFPDPTVFYCFNFSHGYLHIVTGSELKKEEELLLAKFTKIFEQTYTRFLDLQKAEAQAGLIREERDRLEIALNELHAAQDQLVQQEKLASLGQLTAGIAHEIKNPLNFVNNFSEVSLELIEEALEEIAQIENNAHATESSELLTDIKSNLTKIHQHGTRANGIVSSMLQHSRGGSGKMEPTDLNALVKEYVNLAFHGMRAGKNTIDVDIKLDLDEKLGKVNLIGEDFSRVILNLCNNAFDAMGEKAKTANGYTPQLSVQTSISKKGVEVFMIDNGPGIPDDVKDKILQPFFTTKKGTEGTGLGLSITYDIIKAHGGTIEIKTKENQGTAFIISIPVNKTA